MDAASVSLWAALAPHLTSQAWATLAAIATVLAGAVTVLGAFWSPPVRQAIRAVLGILAYLDPLRGIKAHLLSQDGLLSEIAKELKPNGGSSISDKVNAIWTRQGMTAARLGMLLDESDALLWQSNLEGQQVWASRALIEITGRPASELLGWGWTNVIHPDDRNRIRDTWVGCLRDGRNFEERCRFQTLHGTHYAGALIAKPFTFDGRIIAWIGRCTLDGPAVKTNGDEPARRSAPRPVPARKRR